jgi:hypothetical protein
MGGVASIAVFTLASVYGVPAAVSSPDYQARQAAGTQLVSASQAPTTTSTSTTSTTTSTSTTSTTTPPAVLAATPVSPPAAPPPAPTPPPVPATPAVGQGTTWGCAAALAYLETYAAPGFALDCPGYAEGHEAMTCLHGTPEYPDACQSGPTIAISDPCPQAYMNESANSWLLTGQLSTEQQKFGVSYGSIDPFGACP